jgi:DNA-binding NtrC family response regulator
VILIGETGTGKELAATALHELSGRAGPFVPVNCGALAANLAESQLFGHTKGAFSGAVRDEVGFLRSADRGTLLLDEIGDFPASLQPTLLRVLQEGRVVPVGTARAQPIDVRFVSATHKDLAELVAHGDFRRDLLARLNGFVLRLPALRERRRDLGLLVASVLQKHALHEAIRIAPDAAQVLLTYEWPANIRELEQCLLRACALMTDNVIRKQDLPPEFVAGVSAASGEALASIAPAAQDAELKRLLIERLQAHNGNISEVARSFGKARIQIQRWLKRFGMRAEQFRK